MKKHTTSTLAAAITTLVVVLAMAAPAFAANGGAQVQASVEMEQFCVNLDLGSQLSFGAAGLGEEVREVNDQAILVRNSGSDAATIMIQGTDASGPDGATWTLADHAARGSFAWRFVDNAPGAAGNPVFVSRDARVLVQNLGYRQAVALNATLLTPTCSTRPGVYTWGATIYAVPAFE